MAKRLPVLARLGLLLTCLTAGLAQADIGARIQEVMSSPQLQQKAEKAGKKAAFFCENCHGVTGNSVLDYIPNLAGQNPVYLLTQIEKFGDGRRNDEFMSGLIKVLKEEDRFNMAIYYASMDVDKKPAKDANLAAQGKRLFNQTCQGCHGAAALGHSRIARLAGQQNVYLVNSLTKYRSGKGTRLDPVMSAVARKLSDADINAVSAYLSGL